MPDLLGAWRCIWCFLGSLSNRALALFFPGVLTRPACASPPFSLALHRCGRLATPNHESRLRMLVRSITKLRGVLQASCYLKRSDCCLPPAPVYFLEDSRRFYELQSPVLLLLSLTVLQLVSL
ncbi:hypothetical protein LAZ67_X004704 [Cordylochernes scorpioides]|uniref:Secreted protein n=1 Tax=Cordylochernes scorpioides TaxID=51811 RepID=A0ABY6LV76_9ARAC|nr:hypothetical protein LAZ67_X004704 [Cordylochernes scorpioides]